MSTFVYMVRQGESAKEGNERTRGLTEKGNLDAQRVTDILIDEEIDAVVSNPYTRSLLTVEKIAQRIVAKMELTKNRYFLFLNQGGYRFIRLPKFIGV